MGWMGGEMGNGKWERGGGWLREGIKEMVRWFDGRR